MSGWDKHKNSDGDTLADLATAELCRIADALEELVALVEKMMR